MAKLRRPISSLLNGVSQQAPSLRLPSQSEAQINGHPSLADGLIKRPPTEHVKKLTGTIHPSAYIQTINWASDEQFIVVLIDNDLFVYDVDGVSQTVNFPDGKGYLNITTANIDFAAVTVEDIMYIANRTVQVALDGVTTAPGTYQGKVQDFAALPGTPANLDTYLIVGDKTIEAQGHYMQYTTSTGVWEEAANPGDATTFDASTMPHKLTYNSGTGQFTFAQETWDAKAAGDTIISPDPSFLNRYIRDIFFHRNRLGVLAGEYCVLSQSGPYYQNFWSQTSVAVLDNDPIDVRAANIRVSKLNFALPFNRQLAVQSDASQFIMATALGQVLSPATAGLDLSTTYAANAEAKPVTAGNSIFFPSEDGNWASMREYSVSSDSEIVNTADDLTQHVPKFIPSGVFKMTLSEDDDTMFLVTSSDPTRIYTYKYYYEDGQKVQAAWSYWQFDSGDEILSIEMLESYMYAVVARSDGTHLLRLSLTTDTSVADLGFACLLDMRVSLTGSYSAVNDETTWTLPYDGSAYAMQVILGGGFTSSLGARVSSVTQPTATTVVAPGDLSAAACYLGVPYTFTYTFSEQFVRQDSDNDQGSPILDGTLNLRNFAVRYNNTGYIRAEVVPRIGADTFTYVFGGKTIGAKSLVIGSPNIDTGTFTFPVVAKSDNVTISLINDTHMPSKLVSAEWTGNFTSKRGS